MRTLFEIIDSAKDGEMPTHEECYYAMLTFDALHSLGQMELMDSDIDRAESGFRRAKRALEKSPKDWIGWNNDPANPEYQEFRALGKKFVDTFELKDSQNPT